MREVARLLLPAVRWDPARGFTAARHDVLRGIDAGVGGFVIEGGRCDDVATLAEEIRARADEAPIIAVALTTLASREWNDRPLALPAPGAIAALRDPLAVRRAGRAAARAAKRGGCNALLSPSCDLPSVAQPDTFGTDPAIVAGAVAEWIDAAQAEGVLCFAGNFPGSGRARRDAQGSWVVADGDDTIYAADLVPFRAAIDAGVAGLCVANTAYPTLDPSGRPALLSPAVLSGLLRDQLGFDGLVVADASHVAATGEAIADLVTAGNDLVLRPMSVDMAVHALSARVTRGSLDMARVHDASRRRRARAELAGAPERASNVDADRDWLDESAERAIAVVRGRRVRVAAPVEIAVVGATPHESDDVVFALADGIAQAGGDAGGVRRVAMPSGVVRTTFVVVVASGSDVQPAQLDWATHAAERASALCAEARRVGRDAAVVWGGHPATSPLIPAATLIIASWTSDPAMVRAAGRWLVRRV